MTESDSSQIIKSYVFGTTDGLLNLVWQWQNLCQRHYLKNPTERLEKKNKETKTQKRKGGNAMLFHF